MSERKNEKRRLAWELYCQETAGSMDVRDFWEELPPHVQKYYMSSAEAVMTLTEQLANYVDLSVLDDIMRRARQ